MSDLRAHALAYARAGWHVFPVAAGRNAPPLVAWKTSATDDVEQVAAWWDEYPDANIGVAAGPSGLAVIDVDDPTGLAVLEAERGELPTTWVAETPRGGEHHVYVGEIKTTAGQLADGVDTRGRGGYFVAPPSVRPEGAYRWRDRESLTILPEDLSERLEGSGDDEVPSPAEPTGSANDRWGQRVLDGEIAAVATAEEGQRNHTLFNSACKVFEAVKGGHIDEEVAWSHLESVGTRIGLDDHEVSRTLDSAWERTSPRDPLERDEDEEVDPGGEPFEALGLDELANIPPPSYILPRRVPEGLTLLVGPAKTGKTFLAIDWAATIAALVGPVLYFTGEGRKGLARRVLAWSRAHPYANLSGLRVVQTAPQILDPAQVQALYATVRRHRPRLVVVDTLSRATVGADENDATAWTRAIQVTDHLRDAYDASTLLVHHTNASGTRPRGHTSLDGAVDAMWQTEEDGEVHGVVHVKCAAMKDDAPPNSLMRHVVPADDSAIITPSEYGDA